MKTYKENLTAYIRVIEMCEKYNKEHGTDVKPWECVRLHHTKAPLYQHPDFAKYEPEIYQFAITILEAKPVFVGNKVWLKKAEQFITITDLINFDGIRDDFCSWNPPKRETAIINGVELPRPLKEPSTSKGRFIYSGHKGDFYFNDYQEFRKWEDYFTTLLREARDKED